MMALAGVFVSAFAGVSVGTALSAAGSSTAVDDAGAKGEVPGVVISARAGARWSGSAGRSRSPLPLQAASTISSAKRVIRVVCKQ